MGMDKAIESGKEHRKPYQGSKAVDSTCRNHGGCPWCENGRQYKNDRQSVDLQEELAYYLDLHDEQPAQSQEDPND